MTLNIIHNTDCLQGLRELPDCSVNCCVTSPPYYGLRDYGVDGQIGLEETPEAYVEKMVAVFREVRRVLKDDGTLWLNLGDTYAGSGKGGQSEEKRSENWQPQYGNKGKRYGLKPKDLIGIPWAVAKALQKPYYSGIIKNDVEKAWIAAMIDGEGTICGFDHVRTDDGRVRTGINICVTNSSMALLDRCYEIYPTSRSEHNRHGEGHLGLLPTYRWIVHGTENKIQFIKEIYPFLIAKKKQALLAYNLLLFQVDSKKLGKTPMKDGINEKRQLLVSLISELNHGKDITIPSWCIDVDVNSLYADGWYLRQDIIWCLSGGTWLYAKTQKGEMPMMVRDIARLDPSTVKLWNGEKWTRLLGMNRTARRGNELEIVLRSGERISCTPSHKFPTKFGLVEAKDIRVGDALLSCKLPEPTNPRDCAIDNDAAWLAGLYIAEGSMSEDTIQIAGHSKEEDRWNNVLRIATKYGGSATRTIIGNNMNIRIYGKILMSIINELVSGKTSHDKGFAPVVWRYSNSFIGSMVDGYLSGDGHKDGDRWRLGFCRNYNLERDLRTACARLGYSLTLNMSSVKYNGGNNPTFRGELRKTASNHSNNKDRNEVMEIRKSRCRNVWDMGVEDDPHLFALASGILTHNSKPNPMPESVTDRCTKAHEYIFLLSKSARYYYDADAIKTPLALSTISRVSQNIEDQIGSDRVPGKTNGNMKAVVKGLTFGGKKGREYNPEPDDPNFRNGSEQWGRQYELSKDGKANKKSVWVVPTMPFSEAHFATFPEKLIVDMIKAGCPEGGIVLDPFMGAGTTAVVARKLDRNYIGFELNPEYIKIADKRLYQELGMFQ